MVNIMADEKFVSDLPEIRYDKEEDDKEKDYDKVEYMNDVKRKNPRRNVTIESHGITLRRTKRSFVYNYLLAVLVVVLMVLVWAEYGLNVWLPPHNLAETWQTVFTLGSVIVVIVLLEEPVIRRQFTKYTITNNEVIMVRGVFRKMRIIIPYQAISNIDVYKGMTGRVLSFGDMTVVGFKNQIIMKGVKDPDLFYRIINNKIAITRGVRQKVVHEEDKLRGAKTKRKTAKKKGWRERQKEIGKRMKTKNKATSKKKTTAKKSSQKK